MIQTNSRKKEAAPLIGTVSRMGLRSLLNSFKTQWWGMVQRQSEGLS